MAKDDYYVLVYRFLAYLYVKLKEGGPIEEKYIRHDGLLFGVNRLYWTYILEHLLQDGYIENISITKLWGQETLIENLDRVQITPKGIDYLCNNSLLEKAKDFLKDIKAITPFI